ncbi:hypothetical protein C8A01DRAFT_41244 [Parachaetomium inaequale]|uniref:F-box domain-containing protein n=1 Tax=Parachaetomium inaequale TaxID=2588326 RepID=A0AAN6SM26_9PEZI|nr:hypothetical protein C8A01DRAFT_41244 [Parachaetomium inaequale]
MASESQIPEQVSEDFGREYCSLVKAHHNCWRKDSEGPYDELLAWPTAAPPSIARPSAGGIGRLDSLPVELFTNILEGLDFQSLSVFSRTSVRANNAVQALPAYREVMQHARGALSVLAKTRLLAHHPASSLRRALRSRRCGGCNDFGGFLFLPTCERACVECLSRKLSFRLAMPDAIMTYFGLTEDQLTSSIPPLQVLPGNYAAEPQRMGDRVVELCNPGPLVSVRQARDLALRLGVCSNPAEARRFNKPNVYSKWARDSIPCGRDDGPLPSTIVRHMLPAAAADDFVGHGHGPSHVRFPFLRADGQVDRGRWCRGCMRTRSDFMMDKLPEDVVEERAKDSFGGCVATKITAMASRVWAEEEFLEHVKHCYGARVMASRWKGVHWEMKQRGFRPRKMAYVRHIDPKTYQPAPPLQRDDTYDDLETKEHRQYAGDLAEDEPQLRISVSMCKPKKALTYGRQPEK